MKQLAITLFVTVAVLLAAIALAPAPKQHKVAVFGRTMCAMFPELPGCSGQAVHAPIVINKRTSLSGEGEFVRPL